MGWWLLSQSAAPIQLLHSLHNVQIQRERGGNNDFKMHQTLYNANAYHFYAQMAYSLHIAHLYLFFFIIRSCRRCRAFVIAVCWSSFASLKRWCAFFVLYYSAVCNVSQWQMYLNIIRACGVCVCICLCACFIKPIPIHALDMSRQIVKKH